MMHNPQNLTFALVLLILLVAIDNIVAERYERGLRRVNSRLPSLSGSTGGAGRSRVKYLTLAVAWMPGTCFINFSQCSPRQKTVDFTIHGLWAQGDTELRNCPSRETLSDESIRQLSTELEASWKAFKDMRPEILWRYQYNTHGACAGDIDELNSPKKYLRSTLKLFKQLDLKGLLAYNNIKPNNRVAQSGKRILNAIEDYLGVRVRVTCKPSESHPEIYLLEEVRICYGTDLELIDCPYGTSSICKGNIVYATY